MLIDEARHVIVRKGETPNDSHALWRGSRAKLLGCRGTKGGTLYQLLHGKVVGHRGGPFSRRRRSRPSTAFSVSPNASQISCCDQPSRFRSTTSRVRSRARSVVNPLSIRLRNPASASLRSKSSAGSGQWTSDGRLARAAASFASRSARRHQPP